MPLRKTPMIVRYSTTLSGLIVLLVVVCSNDVVADQSLATFSPGLTMTLQHETVNDKVPHAPNLQEGGFAEEVKKQRFQSHGLSMTYSDGRDLRYHFALNQRQLVSFRDAFTVNEIHAGFKRRIQPDTASRYSLELGVDARINHASDIYKNSYTSYRDYLITEVRLVQPRDGRLSANADVAFKATDQLRFNFVLSGGVSQTTQKNVVGSARLGNECRYAFNASTKGGSVQQIESCGALISYVQYYPDNNSLNETLGFSVADDLTYRDYFFGPSASVHWQHRRWSLGAGFAVRQYYRPSIDHRIRQTGDTPVTRSHTAFATVRLKLSRSWSVNTVFKYQKAAFLDDIPFLYTALTHQRYQGKGVLRYGVSVSRRFM